VSSGIFGSVATAESIAHNRIDVHQHLDPLFWSKELESQGGDPSGWDSLLWSPEDAIRLMLRAYGDDVSLISFFPLSTDST